MEKGAKMACILNAANEIAVDGFLNDKIVFLEMSDLIYDSMQKVHFIATYNNYVETDSETRKLADEVILRQKN